MCFYLIITRPISIINSESHLGCDIFVPKAILHIVFLVNFFRVFDKMVVPIMLSVITEKGKK